MYKFVISVMMVFMLVSVAHSGNGNIYKWKSKDGHYVYSNKVNHKKPNMEIICKEIKFDPIKHQARLKKDKEVIENMSEPNISTLSNSIHNSIVEVPIPYLDPTTPYANARRIRDAINTYQKNIELRNKYLEAISK